MKSKTKPVKTKIKPYHTWYQWKGYSILFQNFYKRFPKASSISQKSCTMQEAAFQKYFSFSPLQIPFGEH